VYLAIADDATIRRVTADGVPGTAMPAFAQHSGGMLTDDQINAIVGGIRSRWAKPGALPGADAPPYAAQAPGDPKRGAAVYGIYCSSCHGADGRGGKRASSIVDGSYLALVSDQGLRTTVIVGRPELGAPDWRGDVPGKPMSPEDVSDVVAWLAALRPQFPGQPYRVPCNQKEDFDDRVPDGLSRRRMLMKLGILFNAAVGMILAVPIVRYILSPVTSRAQARVRILAFAWPARSSFRKARRAWRLIETPS
jgi:mono/diheme cytochrome c family protein